MSCDRESDTLTVCVKRLDTSFQPLEEPYDSDMDVLRFTATLLLISFSGENRF